MALALVEKVIAHAFRAFRTVRIAQLTIVVAISSYGQRLIAPQAHSSISTAARVCHSTRAGVVAHTILGIQIPAVCT